MQRKNAEGAESNSVYLDGMKVLPNRPERLSRARGYYDDFILSSI
jgi:hypothetical protein